MHKWITLSCFFAFACKGPGTADTGSPVRQPEISMLPSPGDSTLDQGQPLLHTDPNGTVYLSWVQRVDSNIHQLQYALLTDTGWSRAVPIASGKQWFVNWADFPQFASDGKGHFIATYLQKSGPGTYTYDIMLTRSTGGTDWHTPVKLNEDGKEAEHGFVSMVPAADGFLVTWLDGRRTNPMPTGSHDHDAHDGGQMTLRAALLDTAGRKRWEQELDDRTCDCCQTSVAQASSGPLVVYRDRSANETRDIYFVRMQNNTWQTPQRLHADEWVINGCPVNGPQVKSLGNTVAVTWYTEAHKKPSVFTAFSTDGGMTFGKPLPIHDSIPLGRVDLVLQDEKTARVCWMEGDEILTRQVSIDGSSGQVQRIARNSAARTAGFPQMTIAGNRLVFAWTDALTKRITTATMDISPE